jgi:mannosyltransferase
VLIEAMAAGKPVVAADAGAAREILEDGVQGILVPPRDAQALALAIIDLLSHPDRAAAMGSKGRERARDCFNAQQYVSGVQAVYREVLS